MKFIYVIVLILCAQAVAVADLKVKTRNTAAGRSTESAIYIKGQRQRTEAAGQTSIYQCDLRRSIQANDRTRKYLISPLGDGDETPSADNQVAPLGPAVRQRRGGVVTYTITTIDTGERKQMFGYTARHIKTTTVTDAPQGTCNPGHNEIETDGWYIDLQFAFNCSTDRPAAAPPQPTTTDCRDQIRFKRIGAARLGFPVLLTTKMKVAGMEEPTDPAEAAMMERMAGAMTMTMEVTDISQATLDAALFDVPAGYTQVSSAQELYGTEGGYPSAEGVSASDPAAGRTEGVSEAAAPAPTVAAKRPGMIRVGVLAIHNRTGSGVSTHALRRDLLNSIGDGSVEAVALDEVGAAAEAEAQQKGCDLILHTDITAMKKSAAGKMGGIFGRVTGVSVPGAEEARYESRVEFRLVPVGGGPPRLQSTATAKESNESGSVAAALEKEARAVMAAALKRN
jgi:hypothetical protein